MTMLKLLFISLVLIKVANLTDVSYYEILGISKQASTQEIRQAYKKLAIKLHPDKNPNAKDQEVFLKITEAYETLKDPDKRHKYDVYGSYPSYTRKYDHKSQAEYNNLYYNGLYHDDPFVDTLSAGGFYNYLQEGFHFINFYSPFCPPCQSLVDHWKKLAEVYKGIIKFGAVNCKYYNSFCYNSMRIGSYPTLLFYPNGNTGNYMYYRGDRTFDAIDRYVMNHIGSKVHMPTVTLIRDTERPIAYVLGRNRIEEHALTRIAFHLNNLVTLVIVEDEAVRAKLTKNDYATVVFKHKKVTKEIDATEEKDVLAGIVEALPGIEKIDPENLKKIRNDLRSGHETPWLLYMSTEGDDRLLLNQLRVTLHDFHFGEIDCGTHAELCLSLQAPNGGLAVLKPGGAYQLLPASVDPRQYARVAADAYNLHSLSASELRRALDGESGTWVLLVAPYQLPWESLAAPFTATAMHYAQEWTDLNFGMISCPLSSDQLCRSVASRPAVAIVTEGSLHVYSGEAAKDQIVEFVDLILESKDLELTEQQVLEVSSNTNRREAWAVAFLPRHCPDCDRLLHQWRIVARKLRPLPNVRVGVLNCARLSAGGYCGNVRAAVARVYPPKRGNHYAVNLQNLAEAPYMLEWALDFLTDSVAKLDWQSFSKAQHSDDRRPWLVYYHSPRCYRCYEMYADFVVAGVLLNKAVNVGKVNCISERGLCQQQHITSYPSLKLYLNKNNHQHYNSVVSIGLGGYISILEQIEPHLKGYHENLLDDIDDLGVRAQSFHIKHDEF